MIRAWFRLAFGLTLATPTAAAAQRQFTFALTGDAIITRRLSVYQEPEFTGLIELIRRADAAFTNVEMLFHDFEPWPMHQSGGTYMRAEPELAPDSTDVAEIAAVVRNAAQLADLVLVTIHAHEAGQQNSEPAEFRTTFARAMIDAGADLFVGHGPHVLRGIEVYRGKPIFYSLGDFIFQNETVLRLPAENYATYGLPDSSGGGGVADFNTARYSGDTRGFPAQREIWESVVALPTFRGRSLVSVELVPITLGFGKPRTERGRPMLASGELAGKILGDLAERSKPFGTVIQIRNGRGYVELR